ncbi:MAG TPA: glycosyltransferase [Steroidobacteraceae bacterium]|jgi:glycosyltransferase involved in cell wall biosynthesis|nr:glycosyltransferase [Steroidobacteraceae bacterium]
MRIVLLSGFRIFPTNTGGHIHTACIARALARMGHEVLLYALAGRQADYSLRGLLGPSYHTETIEANLTEETNLGMGYGLTQAIARRLGFPRVWQHALMRRGIVPQRLKAALAAADVILADMPWCPPVPGIWRDKPWFMISHNLEHRLLEQGTSRHRRFAGWMRRVESDAPKNYRDIFACAEEDRDYFRAHDDGGALRLPFIRNGVDPDAYRAAGGVRQETRKNLGVSEEDTLLVFAGSGFGPNLEAFEVLRAFGREHAEFLARERVYFLILGSIQSTPWRQGAFIVTGRVPEVAPYFAAADAGLNPVTRGSGANIKLFEYLAARLPVISTVFGVRGTPLQPDTDFICYAPETMREAIERYLRCRTRTQWRGFADEVWQRHRRSCDIQELMRDAVAELPEFRMKQL